MKIKTSPEDFIVREIFEPDNGGENFVYLLEKKDYTSPEAIRILENKFGVKIKFCGNKDRRAITFQYFSCKKKIPEFSLENKDSYIKTKFVGTNSSPLSLGSHKGNTFEIRIKDFTHDSFEKSEFAFPNYFGEQRFSKHNVEVGKLLLERKFKEALKLIDDKKANDYLIEKEKDFLGALKKIPKTILRIYLSAVQSFEFNKELSDNLEGKKFFVGDQELVFPEIMSFDEKIIMKGWDSGNRSFLFREYPELSLEGEERDGRAHAKNVHFDGEIIKFDLEKSSYATIFLRSVFLEDIKY